MEENRENQNTAELPEERPEGLTREALLKKLGLSEAEFSRLMEDMPELKMAREALREAEEARAEAELEAQLWEIRLLNPAIHSLAELAGTENYEQLCDMVARGYSLADAYRLANFDTLMKNGMNAARQNAVNDIRSKQHLSKTQTVGEGTVSVPDEVRRLYLALNPDASLAEIQKHYARRRR